tara:strand:+ start:27181 stop:27408 length:228 start_codon:yes stop_codon:yes gene_type:complete
MDFSTPDVVIKEIGKKIKILRKSQGMTQLDLAIKSEMEENALQRIETGRTNPTVKTLLKISISLKVDLQELFIFQ